MRQDLKAFERKRQGRSITPGVALLSDFFHSGFRQHIHHDLCAELEGIAKGFTVGQDIDLPLGEYSV